MSRTTAANRGSRVDTTVRRTDIPSRYSGATGATKRVMAARIAPVSPGRAGTAAGDGAAAASAETATAMQTPRMVARVLTPQAWRPGRRPAPPGRGVRPWTVDWCSRRGGDPEIPGTIA